MTVTFKTKLNAQTATELNKFSLKKIWWLILLISLAFAAFGIVGYVFAEDQADKWMGIFLMAMSVLFLPLVWLACILLQKFRNRSAAFITRETDEIYRFDEEKLCLEQTSGDEFKSTETVKYSFLYKVNETATHYFVYISKMLCHVVPKSGLKEGTVEDLNAILSAALGNKFVSLKK